MRNGEEFVDTFDLGARDYPAIPAETEGPRDRPLFTAWRYSRECEDSLALRPREPL